ncbi:hypothetical protein QL285_081793 [Trifolium repens]|nr:hypothetical protein QL285_081793 [Trifolium repens]
MQLRPEEEVVCHDIFTGHVGDKEQSPIVFKVGDNCWALRTDFQCMIPNGWVGDRIITMMINAITWNQKNTYNKEVWWLPPLFATQVGLNTKNEMLEFMFGDQFMPQIDKLKLAAALSQLALSIFEKDIPHCTFPDFDGWEIVEPRGIPNYGHIGNSGLWVAEWLQMQSCFNSQVVGSSMDESILRIKMVMALLLGAHNECREVLIEAANELWLKLHVKHEEAQMLKK